MKLHITFQDTVVEEPQSLAEFIQRLPHVLSDKRRLIPPIDVVNNVLKSGLIESGMSGRYEWEPFLVTKNEYNKFSKELIEQSYSFTQPPEWVNSLNTWHVWTMEYCDGVPSRKHLELLKEIDELNEKLLTAEKSEAPHAIDALKIQISIANDNLAEFIMECYENR